MSKKFKKVETEVPVPLPEGNRVNKEKHLANLEREIVQTASQKTDIVSRKDLMAKEMNIISDNHKIIMSKFKLLKTTWEFETDEDYINNTKLLNQITFEKKLLDYQVQLDRMVNLVKQVELQQESLVKEAERVRGELKNE